MPTRAATAMIMAVPTIALAMPPPVSPTGWGIRVKKAQLREPMPRTTTPPRMRKSGASTTRVAATMAPSPRKLTKRRRRLMLCKVPRRHAAGDAPDHELGHAIHNQSDGEEHQRNLDEGAQVHVTGGFREFIGNHAGQSVSGSEERFGNFRTVADEHGHGHGLAQGASEAKDHCAEDTGAGISEDSEAQHLPAGGTQRQRGFTLLLGHGQHDLAGD